MRISSNVLKTKRKVKNTMKNRKNILLIAILFALCIFTAACNGGEAEAKTIDLNALHDEVVEVYGESFTAGYSGTLEELCSYVSIDASHVEEFFFNMPLMSVHADLFIGIKATEGNADAVETALNAHRDYLINDTMQYPMNTAKVASTTVTRYGDYIFLVMLGEPATMIEDEAEALDFCKAQNKLATDIIAKYFN